MPGHTGYAVPTRQHKLDHTDQESIYLPCLADQNHEVGIGESACPSRDVYCTYMTALSCIFFYKVRYLCVFFRKKKKLYRDQKPPNGFVRFARERHHQTIHFGLEHLTPSHDVTMAV